MHSTISTESGEIGGENDLLVLSALSQLMLTVLVNKLSGPIRGCQSSPDNVAPIRISVIIVLGMHAQNVYTYLS